MRSLRVHAATENFVIHKEARTWFEWIHLLVSFTIPLLMGVLCIALIDASIKRHVKDQRILIDSRPDKICNVTETCKTDDCATREQERDNILVDYQNFLANLLFDDGKKWNSSIAREETLLTLTKLDSARRSLLIRSLYDSGLIFSPVPGERQMTIYLKSANLTSLNLGGLTTIKLNQRVGTNFPNLALRETILTKSSFRRVFLGGSTFQESKLHGADFAGSRTHSDNQTNSSETTSFDNASLVKASFADADFHHATFQESDLTEVNMHRMTCHQCQFDGNRTILLGANLIETNFINSSFVNASLLGAHMQLSRFQYVDFSWADLSQANLTNASFIGCDLRLATVNQQQLNSANILNGTQVPYTTTDYQTEFFTSQTETEQSSTT